MRGSLRGEREGRRESPAVHLLCRGLLRSRIKSVSGSLPLVCFSSSSMFVLSSFVPSRPPSPMYSSTRHGIPDGPSHDNCPSTVVFRFWWKRFGRACARSACSCKLRTVNDRSVDLRNIAKEYEACNLI